MIAGLLNKISFWERRNNLESGVLIRISALSLVPFDWSNLQVEKNWKTFVLNDTILLVAQYREIRCTIVCGQSRCLNKGGHWKLPKPVYNGIKGKSQSFSSSFVSEAVALETKILLSCKDGVQLVWNTWLVVWAREKEIRIIIQLRANCVGPGFKWRNKCTFYASFDVNNL